eukprot:CAMPEP_0201710506 /NCGR_PEP_ID=MMETSP0578-20130828/58664_1 /ASSEMBLY_ACC=CAM_ASM_000663 /TAXON_ID=267565 /ORGANISM="Skeletonema grethea, Strain CCMP 1804" /LENGTH=565 /DNA_ID=CAMNT_0048199537 /DNA_START=126 /DNA_END=1823 /DNA_ORIENTATION=+
MAAAASMEEIGDDEIIRQPDTKVEAEDAKKHEAAADAADPMNDDSYESGSGSESEEEDSEDDSEGGEEDGEAMPDGDSNADLHALLAYSKSRLEKKPEPTPVPEQEDEKNDESDDDQSIHEEAEDEETPLESENSPEAPSTTGSETIPAENTEESPSTTQESPDLNKGFVSKDSQELLEIAKKKLVEAEAKAAADDDEMERARLLKLAEQKVKEAEEKAKRDEEATGNVVKPAVTTTRRSDANSELWALLNYSKMRIETGSTPQLGKKATTPTQRDDVSVNSKLSKSSKRSLNSKKSIASKISTSSGPKAATVTVEGLPPRSPENASDPNVLSSDADAPVPNVTSGDASVDGSVSMANSVEEDEESNSSRSDDEDDSSDEEEEEEEEDDELPSFLKDDEDDVDPVEARKLYEEAKFKAASILSVSEEKLTDVQMLQAIAIAEEAARTGEEKFSTKRSLFKLSEAKIEDLKSFLDFGENKDKSATTPTNSSAEKEPVRWGIGRGRLVKKVGSIFSDFREKCEELDERKKVEREGKPSNSELLDAAMVDIKKQIDEFESIVRKKTGK